jgi:hypothetical protein
MFDKVLQKEIDKKKKIQTILIGMKKNRKGPKIWSLEEWKELIYSFL